jgi:hypothetical protein
MASESLKRSAEISVGHKAFTRDVANNTWHLTDDRCDDAIVERLSYLLTWPDEVTLSISDEVVSHRRRVPDLDLDLIPVPTKKAYYNSPTLLQEEDF